MFTVGTSSPVKLPTGELKTNNILTHTAQPQPRYDNLFLQTVYVYMYD